MAVHQIVATWEEVSKYVFTDTYIETLHKLEIQDRLPQPKTPTGHPPLLTWVGIGVCASPAAASDRPQQNASVERVIETQAHAALHSDPS